MQLNIPQDDQSVLLLNQAMVNPPAPGVVSVVLDLDLIRAIAVPSEEDEIWDVFEKLHVRKNEIFEACITDETRRLIA